MVGLLLRSGANETSPNKYGKTAADMAAVCVDEEGQLGDDVERVHELLANAPADRAWRHRGYLVLCRAHSDRMQQVHEGSCTGTTGGSTAGGRTGGDWAVVVARVVGLQDEDVFRTIVEYL